MMTRYSAWLDGVALHEIDPAVYIMDIEESVPGVNVLTAPHGMGDGQIVVSRRRQSLAVNIRVMVHEYDTARRKEIFTRIAEWAAKGKYLTISDRPGQRLRVMCNALPVAASALKWTNTLSVAFVAYEKPYWEDEYPTKLVLSGNSGSGFIHIGGTAENSPLDVAVKPLSGTLNSLTITAGNTKFTINGMNAAAGNETVIGYDDTGVLIIPTGMRTADSSDDLLAKCSAETAVSFTASTPVQLTISARGRYV